MGVRPHAKPLTVSTIAFIMGLTSIDEKSKVSPCDFAMSLFNHSQ